jgi:hypothetical protein
MSTATETTTSATAATMTTTSAKDLLKQLIHAASSATGFQNFLEQHLADAVKGSVAHRHSLNKAEISKRLPEFLGIVSGGTVALLTAVEEGDAVCGQVLMTRKKHDFKMTQMLDPQAEAVLEVAIWLEVNAVGQIVLLQLIGDTLTPSLAQGMRMSKAPA